MDSTSLFYEDFFDAVEKQISASGKTRKEIASRLFPGRSADTAKSLLSRALSRDNTDVRLTVECLEALMDFCGSEHIMAYFADRYGYDRLLKKTPQDFRRDAQEKIEALSKQMADLMRVLEKTKE